MSMFLALRATRRLLVVQSGEPIAFFRIVWSLGDSECKSALILQGLTGLLAVKSSSMFTKCLSVRFAHNISIT